MKRDVVTLFSEVVGLAAFALLSRTFAAILEATNAAILEATNDEPS